MISMLETIEGTSFTLPSSRRGSRAPSQTVAAKSRVSKALIVYPAPGVLVPVDVLLIKVSFLRFKLILMQPT